MCVHSCTSAETGTMLSAPCITLVQNTLLLCHAYVHLFPNVQCGDPQSIIGCVPDNKLQVVTPHRSALIIVADPD
jgi:hypothetical protein